MAKATTRVDRDKAAILKTIRTAIRLKHSIQADEEIAITLPKVEKEIDRAVALEEIFEVSIDDYLAV